MRAQLDRAVAELHERSTKLERLCPDIALSLRRVDRRVSEGDLPSRARGPGRDDLGAGDRARRRARHRSPGMLKKLASDGYVEHEARGEVKLTRKGPRGRGRRRAAQPAGGTSAHRHSRHAVGRGLRRSLHPRARDLRARRGAPGRRCSAIRKPVRTGIRFRQAISRDPVRIGIPLAQVEAGHDA